MTDDQDKKPKKGVACFFDNPGGEKVCLHFADVTRDDEAASSNWEMKEPFISKAYNVSQLLNDQVPKNELAQIGRIFLTRAFGLSQPRTDRAALLDEIRKNFENVQFPAHLGLKAAEVIDRWETDKQRLEKLTKEKDFHGPWWEVPKRHLEDGSLGFNYLDAKGFVFYLPAFMTLAVNEPSYGRFSMLIFELNPIYEGEFADLYNHFCQKLSLLDSSQRQSVKKFMRFMMEALPLMTPLPIEEIKDVYNSLNHDYWQA